MRDGTCMTFPLRVNIEHFVQRTQAVYSLSARVTSPVTIGCECVSGALLNMFLKKISILLQITTIYLYISQVTN